MPSMPRLISLIHNEERVPFSCCWVLFAFASMVVSCGTSSRNEDQAKGSFELLSPSGEIQMQDDLSYTGSGRIISKNPLAAVSTDKHFQLSFDLTHLGSSLDFISYANRELGQGITLSFSYNDQGDICMSWLSDKACWEHQNRGSKIVLGVDVHNRENPAHILVWSMDSVTALYSGNAVFNSEDTLWKLKGRGVHFGFELKDAVLYNAEVTHAVYAH